MEKRISMRTLILAIEIALLLACGVVLIPGFFYKAGSPLYHRIEYIFSTGFVFVVSIWIAPFLVNLIRITANKTRYPRLPGVAVKESAIFLGCAITAGLIFYFPSARWDLLHANRTVEFIGSFLFLVSIFSYLAVMSTRIAVYCFLHKDGLVKMLGIVIALILIVGILFALGGAASMVTE
jgi:hypothetical protein